MKKIYTYMLITSILSCTTISTFTKNNQNVKNKFSKKTILFTAEDGRTGTYSPLHKTAFLGEEEYKNVVTILKKELNTKSAQKSKKHKDYLGLFIDKTSKKIYYIYGMLKKSTPVNDRPDADVLTEIAIEIDYGPGE